MARMSVECASNLLHHECRYGACECVCHKQKGQAPSPSSQPIPEIGDNAQDNAPRPPNCF